MKVVSSYAVEMKNVRTILLPTIDIYKAAVSYMANCFQEEWDYLRTIPTEGKKRTFAAEKLIHNTKHNEAKYDFDEQFRKFPSYLRRAARNEALGIVAGYHTLLEQWEAGGKRGRAPRLTVDRKCMPSFYRKNMFLETEDPGVIQLKIYRDNDWVWRDFPVSKTDVSYIRRHSAQKEISAPTLECRHKKWFLRFCLTRSVKLTETDVYGQRICAVDLGLNTDAVCTVIEPDGTVLARKFVNFPGEKDHLGKVLGRIARFQREHGSRDVGGFWEYAKRLNSELARRIAGGIADVAVMYSCTHIVFEHLDLRGKKAKGKKKQRIAMWRKGDIQSIAIQKAHEAGIRVSRVCAWGTSAGAYDGSGRVIRGKDAGFGTNAMCRFQNGKTYNCDLNASYNIGARYYCREILKTLPETERSRVGAKVPGCGRRTSCTYADLLEMWNALREIYSEEETA